MIRSGYTDLPLLSTSQSIVLLFSFFLVRMASTIFLCNVTFGFHSLVQPRKIPLSLAGCFSLALLCCSMSLQPQLFLFCAPVLPTGVHLCLSSELSLFSFDDIRFCEMGIGLGTMGVQVVGGY